MLTVWCMNTNYHAPKVEVEILKRQVERHLSVEHEFVCISDRSIDGIDTVRPINSLPGWWLKTSLFAPTVSRDRNLWLDLDVTITNNIDALVEPLGASQLRAILNWPQSGHNTIQSSVMYWEGDSAQIIHDEFKHDWAHWPPRNDMFWDNGQVQWGDQEFATYLRDTGKLEVEYFATADIMSYKYHCRAGLPEGAKVVVFHGKPDPADVNDDWVIKARHGSGYVSSAGMVGVLMA